MRSIWKEDVALPRFPALEQGTKTDTLIIGGGMAGLLCARMLEQAGRDYLLVEAGRICGGVTGNTTAKLTAQHGLIYAKLLKEWGAERAEMYLRANLDALERYRDLCAGLNCGFEERDNFVYALDTPEKLEEELAALDRLGYRAALEKDLPLPFPTAGAVRFSRQAQFHPLRFAAGIARGLNVRENTEVRELRGLTAVTDRGEIRAEHIIVATHFPFLNKHGSYFLKLYQHRSYVLALEGAQTVDGMYVDEGKEGLSFRDAGGRLLLGGGGHRTGKNGGGWAALERFAREHYAGAKEVCRWAAQDCMSLDGAPYIGQYSRSTPGLFVATGFNKWGMTGSMVAAMVLSDLVQGKANEYAPAFSPSRSMLRPQLAANAAQSALHLLTPTAPRCPHLGCALKWNRQERSWDCPCHGSRFEEGGRRLDGPATGDLKR